jgi:hypothetical protein
MFNTIICHIINSIVFKMKSLYDKILQSSNYINKMSTSGAGNYIVTSQQVSQMISEIFEEKNYRRMKKIYRVYGIE